MIYIGPPELPAGLYVVRQYRQDKGVYHIAILDVGNRLQLLVPSGEPIVIHLPPNGLRADPVSATGAWDLVRVIVDEVGARARISAALARPKYELFSNNCEHFVHLIETG